MSLKKTIAAYQKEDGKWEPQTEIEMHPLEESEIRSYWHIHDVSSRAPIKATQEQEHEWLIANGADFVKLQRSKWQEMQDQLEPEIKAAHARAEECSKKWCEHVEYCMANGLDHNTHEKEKYNAIEER